MSATTMAQCLTGSSQQEPVFAGLDEPFGYPDGLNAYGVLTGNPLGGVDPKGLAAAPPLINPVGINKPAGDGWIYKRIEYGPAKIIKQRRFSGSINMKTVKSEDGMCKFLDIGIDHFLETTTQEAANEIWERPNPKYTQMQAELAAANARLDAAQTKLKMDSETLRKLRLAAQHRNEGGAMMTIGVGIGVVSGIGLAVVGVSMFPILGLVTGGIFIVGGAYRAIVTLNADEAANLMAKQVQNDMDRIPAIQETVDSLQQQLDGNLIPRTETERRSVAPRISVNVTWIGRTTLVRIPIP